MVTVVVGQNLIANTVKALVERERPPVPHLAPSSGFSFPSGHTRRRGRHLGGRWCSSSAAAGPCRSKAWLAAGAAAVTVAVAASRVLLGVHWLTDVIGGAALGFGWFVVCSVAFGGALLHFGAPAERVEAEEARLSGVQAPSPRGAPPMPDPAEPSSEQVDSRAGSLAAEPGNDRPGPGRPGQGPAGGVGGAGRGPGDPRPGRPGGHPAPVRRGRQRGLT